MRPLTTTLESPTSTLIEKSLNIRITSLQSSPFECRKSSICCSDGSSPRKKGSCETRQEVSKALEAIEGVLECPICFDTMAASHILSCGHTACGLCLCKWIGKKASCYLCRASHNGPLVPNFSVDEMAAMYFTHRRKIAQGECEAESDWKRWEDRKIKGKEAVHVAEEDRLKGVSPLIPTPMVGYHAFDGRTAEDRRHRLLHFEHELHYQ
ncbi:hypothetical protein K439DRAFT_836640 [Ramaria rubella]|nr:hypothetical protein K439DRAFT_836640 [Ramaria rubella]